jgi:hypothetical protein
MKKNLQFWQTKASKDMTVLATQTERGIFVVLETNIKCSDVDPNGNLLLHLKRETASSLVNVISKALVENPNK